MYCRISESPPAAPLYIQELAPTRQRGRMVVINVVAITGGMKVFQNCALLPKWTNGWMLAS